MKHFSAPLELFILVEGHCQEYGSPVGKGCGRQLEGRPPGDHRGAIDVCQQRPKSFFLPPKTDLETQLNMHLSPAHWGAVAEPPYPLHQAAQAWGSYKWTPPRPCF